MRLSFLLILALCCANTFAQTPTPLSISLDPFISGLGSPVGIYNCGDDRLFVLEQSAGTILVFDANGNGLGTFLDISSLISTGSERGLLGLAFAPDYAVSGHFYVNYTNSSGNTAIARYAVDPGDPNVALPSGTVLLTISQPYPNHNGGHIAFGPDNYLYIGMGDGGSGGDPQNNAQNINSLLGKILRIDVSGGGAYSIPIDNPYASVAGADEIWAVGVRNPWKFSFDRETGDLWIADVGQNAWEEVNFEPAGAGGMNYGWRCYEGLASYNTSNCNAQNFYEDPVVVFPHSSPDNYCSITGGFVYRGTESTAMQGLYFFTDYCNGQIRTLTTDGNYTESTVNTEIGFGNVAFGENAAGDLFLANLNGTIYKLTDTCPVNASISSDGNGNILVSGGTEYWWYLNGTLVPGENGSSYTPDASGTVYAVIGNGTCARASNTLNWQVNTGGIPGCTYPDATNYDPVAELDDGTCTFELASTCPADINGDLIVGTGDLLELLASFGEACN